MSDEKSQQAGKKDDVALSGTSTRSNPEVLLMLSGGNEGPTSHTLWDCLLTDNGILRVKVLSGSELLSSSIADVILFPVRPRSGGKQIVNLVTKRERALEELSVKELLSSGIAEDLIPWSDVLDANMRPIIKIGRFSLGKKTGLVTIRWEGGKVTFPIRPGERAKLQDILKSKIGQRLTVKE